MAELDKCWGNRAAPWLLWSTAWVGEGSLEGALKGCSTVQRRAMEAQIVQERDTLSKVQKMKCSKS